MITLKKKSHSILKFNPVYKKVPVFVHGGKPIADSILILHYIDDTWKDNPILPQHPYHKALALFWPNFLDGKLLPALIKARRSKEGKEREEAIAEAGEALRALEEELKGKKFFGGETLGFVDIVANFIPYWSPAMEEALGVQILSNELQKLPRLSQWCHDFLQHPIVKHNLPPKTQLLSFFKSQFGPNNLASSK